MVRVAAIVCAVLTILGRPLPAASTSFLVEGKKHLEQRRWTEALEVLVRATTADPDGAEAWELRGRAESRLALFSSAHHSLTRAVELSPHHPAAVAALARLHLAISDLGTVERLLDPFLDGADPPREILHVSGSVSLAMRSLDDARQLYERTLAEDPDWAPGLLGLAAVEEAHNRIDPAIHLLRRVLLQEPDNPEALSRLGFLLFRKRKIEEATRSFLAATRSDPCHPGPHRCLGNGIYGLAYPEREVGARDRHAASLQVERGSNAWRQGDLDSSTKAFRDALTHDPLCLPAHNGLSVIVETRLDAFAREQGVVSSNHWRPSTPGMRRSLERFLLGSDQLSSRDWDVVDASVRPFAQYITRLVAVGASHEILPLHVGLTVSEKRDYNRGRYTRDLRTHDGLRALGGFDAATGIEKLSEAAACRFNTFAHEFAHQVHHYALDPEDREAIRRLYHQAMRRGNALDYFARTDENEYFAVGYEAYVSSRKRQGLAVTEGHTRDELREKDPALFALIQRLANERPGPPTPWKTGEWLWQLGRFEPAARQYASVIRGTSRWVTAQMRAAEAYARAGRISMATRLLERGRGLRIRPPELAAVQAEIDYQKARSPEAALQALRTLSRNGRRTGHYARALWHAGHRDQCLLTASSLLRRNPRSLDALITLARIHASEDDADGALLYLRRATEADPSHPVAWAELGRVLALVRGEGDRETREALRLALVLGGEKPIVQCIVGEAHLALGDQENARGHFTAALAKKQSCARARVGLARIHRELGEGQTAADHLDDAFAGVTKVPRFSGTDRGIEAVEATADAMTLRATMALRAATAIER